ncbi:hypothetical protein DF186_15820, partial [Enterococcus hirae]
PYLNTLQPLLSTKIINHKHTLFYTTTTHINPSIIHKPKKYHQTLQFKPLTIIKNQPKNLIKK